MRWVEALAIRKANANTVIEELNPRIFLRFGCPEVFMSDNGTEFQNQAIDEFLTERGVHHINTPPYHPQANPIERANRTLTTMIASYLHKRRNS